MVEAGRSESILRSVRRIAIGLRADGRLLLVPDGLRREHGCLFGVRHEVFTWLVDCPVDVPSAKGVRTAVRVVSLLDGRRKREGRCRFAVFDSLGFVVRLRSSADLIILERNVHFFFSFVEPVFYIMPNCQFTDDSLWHLWTMIAPPPLRIGLCELVSRQGAIYSLWKPLCGFLDFIELDFRGSTT